MNYEKIYNEIIQKSQSENRVKSELVYFENHHIIPKSLGGRVFSEEHKKKLSLHRKNLPIVCCPHCLKKGNKGNMTRWHFNNCKHKLKIA